MFGHDIPTSMKSQEICYSVHDRNETIVGFLVSLVAILILATPSIQTLTIDTNSLMGLAEIIE